MFVKKNVRIAHLFVQKAGASAWLKASQTLSG
jgi:hypothetical protein